MRSGTKALTGFFRPLAQAVVSRAMRRDVPPAPTGASAQRTYQSFVLDALQRQGTVPLDALVRDVAESAMRADLLQGAADAELAVSGQSVYRLIAADAILQMIGHSLVLECEGPWVLASPAARAAPAVPPGGVSAASGGESPADRRAAA
jgi:hypothetical protein